MLVCDLFKVPRTVGAVLGVELEMEGRYPSLEPLGDDTLWRSVGDGSLRDGREFVFRQPLGSVRAKEALDQMAELMKAQGCKPDYSFRTSTHVHINVANLTLEETKTILLLYYLFEDLYMGFCHKTRQNNRFCLSMKDADAIVDQLRSFTSFNRLPSENSGKYCAMNMCTLAKYGTLEFRALEGTDDWNRMYTWIRAIMACRKAGKEIGSVSKLREMPMEDMLEKLFPTERLKAQFVGNKDVESMYKMNRSILCSVLEA